MIVSPERVNIANAELVLVSEGSTRVVDMRDDADSPGSWTVSRIQSFRRNLRGPNASIGVVSDGERQQGNTGVVF
jgi:hypothetical protein